MMSDAQAHTGSPEFRQQEGGKGKGKGRPRQGPPFLKENFSFHSPKFCAISSYYPYRVSITLVPRWVVSGDQIPETHRYRSPSLRSLEIVKNTAASARLSRRIKPVTLPLSDTPRVTRDHISLPLPVHHVRSSPFCKTSFACCRRKASRSKYSNQYRRPNGRARALSLSAHPGTPLETQLSPQLGAMSGNGFTSLGRGGAGNMVSSSKSPPLHTKDLVTPTLKTPMVTTGRCVDSLISVAGVF